MSLAETDTVQTKRVESSAVDPRVAALLAQMTLEEKVGEMTQLTIQAVSASRSAPGQTHTLDIDLLEEALLKYNVGSLLNVYDMAYSVEHWHHIITTVQDVASKRRLKIPVLYGIDAVHGHNYMLESTLFPHNIALAATWNPELVREANRITAFETRASGIRWNFSPVLDVARQPAWSRFFETFGEDVYVASVMGAAAVDGLQGDALSDSHRVAACAKHFLGYSAPNTGKDRTPAWIPERFLREHFLPPFKAAIDNGVKTVMINSGEINGVPVHASHDILTGLLRDELGFEGVAVSDWEDIIRLHTNHRVAESPRDAVKMSVMAGIDMSMVPFNYSFYNDLISLVHDGEVPMTRIDEAVARILKLKFDVGLFDNPLPEREMLNGIRTTESEAVSLECAREAITLVKNAADILPLKKNTRILITGAGATSLAATHGAWSYLWQGTHPDSYPDFLPNVLESVSTLAEDECVTYVDGGGFHSEGLIDAAVDAAESSDIAIVVLAEEPSAEKPGDIEDLAMPESQLKLTREIQATGTPVVVVVLSNRPRIIRPIVDDAAAVVLAYQPGPFGGQAIAEVLYGDANPSGKLPFTYPRFAHSLVPYDHKNSEKSDKDLGENAFTPQWEFGHGLSFTEYHYSDIAVAKNVVEGGGELTVEVTVTNTGSRAGKESVLLFVRDLYASITPPVKRLRRFQKIFLEPGASKRIRFELAVSELAFIGLENKPIVERGGFEAIIGDQTVSFEVR